MVLATGNNVTWFTESFDFDDGELFERVSVVHLNVGRLMKLAEHNEHLVVNFCHSVDAYNANHSTRNTALALDVRFVSASNDPVYVVLK